MNNSILRRQLLNWFKKNKRRLPWRSRSSPYRTWISEMMLQQTQVKTVVPYFERWMKALPSVHALSKASEHRVLQLWQGLGYYSRARQLKKAADYLTKAFLSLSNDYSNNPAAEKRQALLKLAGYLEKNFPEVNITAASVPCKETACGAVFNYSLELRAIKNRVEANSALDQPIKEAVFGNLENAALAAGENDLTRQFNSLSTAFYNLRGVWQKNKKSIDH